MTESHANRVVCPQCGRVRLETPPGTTALPTLGMARKAAGAVSACDCGKPPHERPGAIPEPGGAGSAADHEG